MDIKYIGNRVSVSERDDSLLIVISGKIDKTQVQMLTVWITAWSISGLAVFSQMFGDYNNDLKLSLLVYLAFWSYFEYKIGYAFLWRKWGAELIKLDQEKLSIKRDIKGYGIIDAYLLENISNIGLIDKPDNSLIQTLNNSFWSISEKSLTFNYFNKSISFGIQLTNEEAKAVLGKIKSKIRKMA